VVEIYIPRYFLLGTPIFSTVAGHLDKSKPLELKVEAGKNDAFLKEVGHRLSWSNFAKSWVAQWSSLYASTSSNDHVGCMLPRETFPASNQALASLELDCKMKTTNET
jgi:hypothetical protein